jgi:hypothetical protein
MGPTVLEVPVVIQEDTKLSDTLALNLRNSYKFKNPVA